jgi:hypothetical protein
VETRVGNCLSQFSLTYQGQTKHEVNVLVQLVKMVGNGLSDKNLPQVEEVLPSLMRQFYDHSWLTIQPTTGLKQSPFPLHLSIVHHIASYIKDVVSC